MTPAALSNHPVTAGRSLGRHPARSEDGTTGPEPIRVAGRWLKPSPVFDTYWRFAAERQAVYFARIRGESQPWTNDPVIAQHRFTNCYRAADRVSQHLISRVAYADETDDPAVLTFRILLFKFFNKISTWDALCQELGGFPTPKTFNVDTFDRILGSRLDRGVRLYSAAYIIPPPPMGAARKHTNHLRLLAHLLHRRVPQQLMNARTMEEAYQTLLALPGVGPFLAYQFLIDLNYSTMLNFNEMDFVVPGPGARDGIRKCFGDDARGIEAQIIAYMAEYQQAHFARLGLAFGGLYGRELQLVDCQNLFCEVDKYARVVHPEQAGLSGRTRIKQRFTADPVAIRPWFPPKWGLNDRVGSTPLAS